MRALGESLASNSATGVLVSCSHVGVSVWIRNRSPPALTSITFPSLESCMPPTRARRLVQSVGPSSDGTFTAAASIGVVSISSLDVLVVTSYSMRLRPWRKTKLLPSGIQVGAPANPPPRPPRPPALRVSSVIGCFCAKTDAARRRKMQNLLIITIVAIGYGTAPSFHFARERRQRRQHAGDHLPGLLVGQIAIHVAE